MLSYVECKRNKSAESRSRCSSKLKVYENIQFKVFLLYIGSPRRRQLLKKLKNELQNHGLEGKKLFQGLLQLSSEPYVALDRHLEYIKTKHKIPASQENSISISEKLKDLIVKNKKENIRLCSKQYLTDKLLLKTKQINHQSESDLNLSNRSINIMHDDLEKALIECDRKLGVTDKDDPSFNKDAVIQNNNMHGLNKVHEDHVITKNVIKEVASDQNEANKLNQINNTQDEYIQRTFPVKIDIEKINMNLSDYSLSTPLKQTRNSNQFERKRNQDALNFDEIEYAASDKENRIDQCKVIESKNVNNNNTKVILKKLRNFRKCLHYFGDFTSKEIGEIKNLINQLFGKKEVSSIDSLDMQMNEKRLLIDKKTLQNINEILNHIGVENTFFKIENKENINIEYGNKVTKNVEKLKLFNESKATPNKQVNLQITTNINDRYLSLPVLSDDDELLKYMEMSKLKESTMESVTLHDEIDKSVLKELKTSDREQELNLPKFNIVTPISKKKEKLLDNTPNLTFIHDGDKIYKLISCDNKLRIENVTEDKDSIKDSNITVNITNSVESMSNLNFTEKNDELTKDKRKTTTLSRAVQNNLEKGIMETLPTIMSVSPNNEQTQNLNHQVENDKNLQINKQQQIIKVKPIKDISIKNKANKIHKNVTVKIDKEVDDLEMSANKALYKLDQTANELLAAESCVAVSDKETAKDADNSILKDMSERSSNNFTNENTAQGDRVTDKNLSTHKQKTVRYPILRVLTDAELGCKRYPTLTATRNEESASRIVKPVRQTFPTTSDIASNSVFETLPKQSSTAEMNNTILAQKVATRNLLRDIFKCINGIREIVYNYYSSGKLKPTKLYTQYNTLNQTLILQLKSFSVLLNSTDYFNMIKYIIKEFNKNSLFVPLSFEEMNKYIKITYKDITVAQTCPNRQLNQKSVIVAHNSTNNSITHQLNLQDNTTSTYAANTDQDQCQVNYNVPNKYTHIQHITAKDNRIVAASQSTSSQNQVNIKTVASNISNTISNRSSNSHKQKDQIEGTTNSPSTPIVNEGSQEIRLNLQEPTKCATINKDNVLRTNTINSIDKTIYYTRPNTNINQATQQDPMNFQGINYPSLTLPSTSQVLPQIPQVNSQDTMAYLNRAIMCKAAQQVNTQKKPSSFDALSIGTQRNYHSKINIQQKASISNNNLFQNQNSSNNYSLPPLMSQQSFNCNLQKDLPSYNMVSQNFASTSIHNMQNVYFDRTAVNNYSTTNTLKQYFINPAVASFQFNNRVTNEHSLNQTVIHENVHKQITPEISNAMPIHSTIQTQAPLFTQARVNPIINQPQTIHNNHLNFSRANSTSNFNLHIFSPNDINRLLEQLTFYFKNNFLQHHCMSLSTYKNYLQEHHNLYQFYNALESYTHNRKRKLVSCAEQNFDKSYNLNIVEKCTDHNVNEVNTEPATKIQKIVSQPILQIEEAYNLKHADQQIDGKLQKPNTLDQSNFLQLKLQLTIEPSSNLEITKLQKINKTQDLETLKIGDLLSNVKSELQSLLKTNNLDQSDKIKLEKERSICLLNQCSLPQSRIKPHSTIDSLDNDVKIISTIKTPCISSLKDETKSFDTVKTENNHLEKEKPMLSLDDDIEIISTIEKPRILPLKDKIDSIQTEVDHLQKEKLMISKLIEINSLKDSMNKATYLTLSKSESNNSITNACTAKGEKIIDNVVSSSCSMVTQSNELITSGNELSLSSLSENKKHLDAYDKHLSKNINDVGIIKEKKTLDAYIENEVSLSRSNLSPVSKMFEIATRNPAEELPCISDVCSISQNIFDTWGINCLDSTSNYLDHVKQNTQTDIKPIKWLVEEKICLRCKGKSTIVCGICLKASYCCKRCQVLHWKSDHYKHCNGSYNTE